MVAQSTKETNEIEYLTNLTRRKTEITVMKKALEERQTLRAGRSNAEPKIFAPPQTPSRGRRTAKI